MLIFRRRAKHAWINWIVPGRFKHVAAFGYVSECDAYIFYDAWLGGTSIYVARGATARAMMMQWTRDSVVLRMDAIPPRPGVWWPRMFCTGAIARLVGVPGALLPISLFRQCLAHGAVIVHGYTEPTAARSPADCAGAAGTAGSSQRAAG
jgi:hypothetical protein